MKNRDVLKSHNTVVSVICKAWPVSILSLLFLKQIYFDGTIMQHTIANEKHSLYVLLETTPILGEIIAVLCPTCQLLIPRQTCHTAPSAGGILGPAK